MNKYYVYEFIRLDYNEPFYIGKGCDERWKVLQRHNNYHFNNICKNIPVAVNILHDNLDEQTAFEYECWYIWQLRDIQGYSLVNIDDGGKGTNAWLNITEEQKLIRKQKISRQLKNRFKNKNNHPSYGNKRPDNIERMKKFRGKNHWAYGKKRPEHSKRMSGSNNPRFGSKSFAGANNPHSKGIILLDKNNNIVKEYSFIKEFLEDEWRKQFPSPNNRVYIFKCLKEGLDFHGYKLVYKK